MLYLSELNNCHMLIHQHLKVNLYKKAKMSAHLHRS